MFYFLGWAGFGFWPLSLLCLVPLWGALELGLGRTWRHTLAVAWLYGTVTCAGGYHWLVEFLDVFSGYGFVPSTLFWLIFSAYLGFNFAVYGLVYRALRLRGWNTSIVAIPVLLLIEWLYPSLFPTYLANSLQHQTTLVQVADLGGPMLVTVVMALVNLSIYEASRWWPRRGKAPIRLWGLTAAAVTFTLIYGHHPDRPSRSDDGGCPCPSPRHRSGQHGDLREADGGPRRPPATPRTKPSVGRGGRAGPDCMARIRLRRRPAPSSAHRCNPSSTRPSNSDPLRGRVDERVAGKRKIYNTVFPDRRTGNGSVDVRQNLPADVR